MIKKIKDEFIKNSSVKMEKEKMVNDRFTELEKTYLICDKKAVENTIKELRGINKKELNKLYSQNYLNLSQDEINKKYELLERHFGENFTFSDMYPTLLWSENSHKTVKKLKEVVRNIIANDADTVTTIYDKSALKLDVILWNKNGITHTFSIPLLSGIALNIIVDNTILFLRKTRKK